MSQTFLGMPAGAGQQPENLPHTGGWVTTVDVPSDPLRWGTTFTKGAHRTLQNTQMRRNLGSSSSRPT